ncbi:hypothetical protein [Novosphingobium sp.]|uniref:hypothetical protein n=1 Tax=Novosphingobium sp. TaxID=1874826 RepID=UPI002FE37C35
MTIPKRRRKFSGVAAVSIVLLAIAVLIWAWTNGGRSPVRDIVQPVPVPELPQ